MCDFTGKLENFSSNIEVGRRCCCVDPVITVNFVRFGVPQMYRWKPFRYLAVFGRAGYLEACRWHGSGVVEEPVVQSRVASTNGGFLLIVSTEIPIVICSFRVYQVHLAAENEIFLYFCHTFTRRDLWENDINVITLSWVVNVVGVCWFDRGSSVVGTCVISVWRRRCHTILMMSEVTPSSEEWSLLTASETPTMSVVDSWWQMCSSSMVRHASMKVSAKTGNFRGFTTFFTTLCRC